MRKESLSLAALIMVGLLVTTPATEAGRRRGTNFRACREAGMAAESACRAVCGNTLNCFDACGRHGLAVENACLGYGMV